ncbi:MAG TPA: vitamin K epoxide reductase family protein [Phycisphaerae bacterium]|nr:vitamin K epoxide reductase family protein [Phycisphaerae bacterium]HNU43781.1 vitamin K epoxide reductase family protein [Phycisphaerae bacterium]
MSDSPNTQVPPVGEGPFPSETAAPHPGGHKCGCASAFKCAVQVVAVVLALAAAYISYLLLLEHVTGSAGPSWFEAVCQADAGTTTPANSADAAGATSKSGEMSTNEASNAAGPASPTEGAGAPGTSTPTRGAGEPQAYTRDCDTVLKGDYGVWPPRKPGDPDNVRRTPVAFLGLLYYSFLAVWFVGVGSPSRDRLWVHFFPLGMVTTGLAGSAFFTWIMFTREEAWCPWCLVTHGLNLALAVCLLLAWPPRPRGASLVSVGSRPSARQALAALVAMALAAYGHFALLGALHQRRLVLTAEANVQQLQQLVDRLKGDRTRMMARWLREEKRTITLRADDPVAPFQHGEKTLQVVVFSDFQCPFCKQVAQFLEKDAQPLFDRHMRIIFKHYPLHPQCNANVKTAVHKMSCYTSALAEAARLQGGNDAFWKAHDYLFEHQRETEKLSIDAFSQALGLDPERVRDDMKSEQAARRIWEDVGEGQKCQLRATPSVFINGRYVESLMVRDVEFWDAVADQYWRTIGKPRPEHTKRADLAGAGAVPLPEEDAPPSTAEPAETLINGPVTPDNPGPPGGP